MPEIEVTVFDNGKERCKHLFSVRVEFGRQRRASEPLYVPMTSEAGATRLVVAESAEDNVGRQHAELEPLDADRARVVNLSKVQPIYFESPAGPPLMPGEKRDVGMPQLLRLGLTRVLRVARPDEGPSGPSGRTDSLDGATLPPGVGRGPVRLKLTDPQDMLRPQDVLQWLAGVMNVMQADPATTDDFFARAAEAAVDLIELDCSRVLFRDGAGWVERASHTAATHANRPARAVSQTLLGDLLEKKGTVWLAPTAGSPLSMLGLESVVAAPILDRRGEVLGALYGEREPRLTGDGGGGPISRVEAMLVEVLAQGVAAGLARVEEEKKASGAITLFEQFFGPALARYLAQTPGWDQARQADVTLLFCDIKGFTRISRGLSPQLTYEWVNDVLNMLSECVLNNNGVLVDYVGDEVMSMWGAPQDCPDHAARACQAAMDMIAGLAGVNKKWGPVFREYNVDEVTDLAVGLNSGTAQVGNVGSKYKFKYGAQGPTVNVASRVMNANKFFKTRVLMTQHTHEQPGVKAAFRTRRLGGVRLNNVRDPLEIHEMVPAGRPDWPAWRDEYERALKHFEGVAGGVDTCVVKQVADGEFGAAGRILASWRAEHQDDLAALVLLSRTVSAIIDGPAATHPVWEFKEK